MFTMMIVRICYNVRYFIVIMAIMILGFTFTFYIMFNESDTLYVSEKSGNFRNIIKSVISTCKHSPATTYMYSVIVF